MKDIDILNALLANDEPSSVPVIANNVKDLTGSEPPHQDVLLALKRLQKDGMVRGTAAPFVGLVWKETAKGRLAI